MPLARIDSEASLEALLAQPSPLDIESLARLDGDLLILGVGGKMGPSLATRAADALRQAGSRSAVIAVARFTDPKARAALDHAGVRTIAADLLAPGALALLPDAPHVIYMAARKFGTTGQEYLTWATNAYLPGLVAERFRQSRIAAFSTGNVYPLRHARSGGATEETPPAPVGEYGQSALARERMFEYGSRTWHTPVVLLRLNYAIDLRYGVLTDIALCVRDSRPVQLSTGLVNVIWQGDANSVCLRSLEFCQSPPRVFNLTGPETLPVRYLAEQLGVRLGIEPLFSGDESETALLSNAALAHSLFGYPTVPVSHMLDWVAAWVKEGQPVYDKPTHFGVRDGAF